MTDTIINLIVEIIFALFVVGCLYFLGLAGKRLQAEIEDGDATQFEKIIYKFVRAAEQMLKKDDPDGTKRKEYVIDRLRELGVEITNEIEALIEAAVYDLNIETTQMDDLFFIADIDPGDEIEEEQIVE